MKAVININMDNAAFQDTGMPGRELGRILTEAATKVYLNPDIKPGFSLPLRDMNGNKVGELAVKKPMGTVKMCLDLGYTAEQSDLVGDIDELFEKAIKLKLISGDDAQRLGQICGQMCGEYTGKLKKKG